MSGIYIRTEKHREQARILCKKLSKLPRTIKQIEASRNNAKRLNSIPKSISQIEQARLAVIVLHKLPRTQKQLDNASRMGKKYCEIAHKLPRTRKQLEASWTRGIKFTDIHKCNLRKAHLGKTGKNASNWKGGLTSLCGLIRTSDKYKDWRKKVFIRDNYTCQKCGKEGGNLHAHHKKEFSRIVRENNILSLEQALSCLELWDIKNGETLCSKPCHKRHIKYKEEE